MLLTKEEIRLLTLFSMMNKQEPVEHEDEYKYGGPVMDRVMRIMGWISIGSLGILAVEGIMYLRYLAGY